MQDFLSLLRLPRYFPHNARNEDDILPKEEMEFRKSYKNFYSRVERCKDSPFAVTDSESKDKNIVIDRSNEFGQSIIISKFLIQLSYMYFFPCVLLHDRYRAFCLQKISSKSIHFLVPSWIKDKFPDYLQSSYSSLLHEQDNNENVLILNYLSNLHLHDTH